MLMVRFLPFLIAVAISMILIGFYDSASTTIQAIEVIVPS
jgi:hypothetical protein